MVKKKIKLEISNQNDQLLDLFCMKKYIFGIFYFEKRSIKREGRPMSEKI